MLKMASNQHNALAELADWLKRLVDANGGKKCRAVANIDKASRIIAELAKVKVEAIKENPSMVGGAFINLMAECRAIAEE